MYSVTVFEINKESDFKQKYEKECDISLTNNLSGVNVKIHNSK